MPKKRSYKLITIEPDGTEIEIVIDRRPTLEELQSAVQGPVEHIEARFMGRMREAYVNEEGQLRSLLQNNKASWLTLQPIVGNICIVVPL